MTASPARSVRNAKCRQWGHKLRLGGLGESGAAHDETPAAVDALGHFGLAVVGVANSLLTPPASSMVAITLATVGFGACEQPRCSRHRGVPTL